MHTGPLSLEARGSLPALLTVFTLVCRLLSPSSLKTFSEYQPHFPFLCCLFKGQHHSRFSRVLVEWSPVPYNLHFGMRVGAAVPRWRLRKSPFPEQGPQELCLGYFKYLASKHLKQPLYPCFIFPLRPVVAMEPELGENTHIHLENLAFTQMFWSKRELIG